MLRSLRTVGFLAFLALLVGAEPVAAQYFGRNKVQYETFDFRQFSTDNFEIYFYPEGREAVTDASRMAERWYRRHSRTFLREFDERKPLILYANDTDFQQTNVIQGNIGQGTGGVTESLKERVVMPLTGSYRETDHVLGHELVHSFQYDIALRGDTQNFSLRRLPLWMVEGMAEYLSLGREHPHTAMWLRDAALRDDLPTVSQMTSDMYSYFPYRFGQAYMAYIGGKYGDSAVTNLFKLSGRVGVDSSFVYALGITPDSLSAEWKRAVNDAYMPLMEGRTAASEIGEPLLGTPGEENQFNVSPAVSPDGRYVAYISRRNLFTTNLFVADAQTGEVIQELRSTRSNPHFDALRFINSAGTWSPDGRRFAFVTYTQGRNEINILDVESGRIQRRFSVGDVGAIRTLAWSPEGNSIALTGIQGGLSDLYLIDLNTDEAEQLTNDRFAYLQPTWSPDGETIAFTTDRGTNGTNFETLQYGEYRIGFIDVESREIRSLRPFERGMHHNPQYAPDGRSLYFISDQDGFKDVYRYAFDEEAVYRLTDVKTGISGITALSPAMSVAQQSGRMAFSVFSNGGYSIVALDGEDLTGTRVDFTTLSAAAADSTLFEQRPSPASDTTAADTERLTVEELVDALAIASVPADTTDIPDAVRDPTVVASTLPSSSLPQAPGRLLPPPSDYDDGLVASYLEDPLTGLPSSGPTEAEEYSSRLQLDRIAPPQVGAQVGGRFGSQFVGGVGFFFSDMLGDRSLSTFVQANGTIKDIGGGAFYQDREQRLNYGAGLAHIPTVFGSVAFDRDTQEIVQFIQRRFQTQAFGQATYPISQTRRFELSAGGTRYGFDTEAVAIDQFGRVRERNFDEFTPDTIYLGQVGVAYVGDFSNFGFTSPLNGGRYRFQVTPNFGSRNFVSVLADYRRYFFMEPVTVAFRALHQGNYGAQPDNVLSGQVESSFVRETLGDPYQLGFVRGYAFSSIFEEPQCGGSLQPGSCEVLGRLLGTRMGVASAEVRLPFLGTDQLGLFNFPYLPTEIVAFGDAGIAWTSEDLRDFTFTNSSIQQSNGFGTSPARPVFSVGVSARVNLLGALVFETFYARTFQRANDWDFGVLLRPGW
jgi:Tol biopolymer transport system component